jgi:hypothetical protein
MVNGHPIWQTTNAAKMFPTGSIALQLHDGGKNDTILFRNLDLYLPRKLAGCLDSSYVQYDKEANFAVTDSCKTKKVSGLAASRRPAEAHIMTINGYLEVSLPQGARGLEVFDLGGRLVWSSAVGMSGRRKARIEVGKGIFRSRISW